MQLPESGQGTGGRLEALELTYVVAGFARQARAGGARPYVSPTSREVPSGFSTQHSSLALDRDLVHHHRRDRPVVAVGFDFTDLLDDVEAFDDSAEDGV